MANWAHLSPGHTQHLEWILHVTAEFPGGEPEQLRSSKIRTYPLHAIQTCNLFSWLSSCNLLCLCCWRLLLLRSTPFHLLVVEEPRYAHIECAYTCSSAAPWVTTQLTYLYNHKHSYRAS